MGFDLGAELAAVRGQGYELHSKYLNPQMPRTLHTIGFDKDYVRGEGAYLYDADGNAYADFLSGFGVFAAGRNHPVIKKALQDALEMDFAAGTQCDCQPIMGLLGQKLLAKAPGLERVFFCNSGSEAVESALKFARHATGKGRILYARHGFHGLTAGGRCRRPDRGGGPGPRRHDDSARLPARGQGTAALPRRIADLRRGPGRP